MEFVASFVLIKWLLPAIAIVQFGNSFSNQWLLKRKGYKY
jgi:hypothetical protein